MNFTLASGLGETQAGQGVTKAGPGFLNLLGPSPFLGGLHD